MTRRRVRIFVAMAVAVVACMSVVIAQVTPGAAEAIEKQREDAAVDQAVDERDRPQRSGESQGVPDPGMKQAPGAVEARERPEPEPAADPEPSLNDRLGVTEMRERLGRDAPTGAGVAVGQVEGAPGAYLAATGQRWPGRTVLIAHGGPSDAFGHAAAVGKIIYGNGGVAPSVPSVHAYPVPTWISDVLRVGSPEPPATTQARVFNHSWIAENPRAGDRILRRLDWQIDRRGVIAVVGVNNGDTAVPQLLGTAHNAIAVGNGRGDSSGGYTRGEVEGRCKPDLVAPGGLTSFTTAAVTGIIACLLEQADRLPPATAEDATRPEVVKTLLYAGAVRGDAWEPEGDRPLDERLGAGRAHALRSLLPLLAGRAEPGRLGARAGWAFEDASAGETQRFEITTSEAMGPVAVALTWHRRIDGSTVTHPDGRLQVWDHTPRTTDFDLRLLRLGDGEPETVAQSVSRVDNAELIHLDALPAGRYAFEVERVGGGDDARWTYAMAYLFDATR